jgi:proteasome-associated ATPase
VALPGELDLREHVRLLTERLRETEAGLGVVTGQNERLATALREARDQIVALKEEVDRLAQPPSGFGIFLGSANADTAYVLAAGQKMLVDVSPAVDQASLRPGQEVVLNEAFSLIDTEG